MNETDCAYYRGYGCRFGVRNDAQDPNLSRRVGHRVGCALSATAATAAASTAADGQLSGWIDGPGGSDLSAAATAATATAATPDTPIRRTRLISKEAVARAPAST